MAQLRLAGLKASPPPAPSARARVAGVAASGTVSAAARLRFTSIGAYGTRLPGANVRLSGVAVSGTPAAIAKVRVAGLRASGTVAIALQSIVARTVDPFTAVSITASVLAGGPATSWEWRQLEGPVVTLTGFGPTRSFDALAMLDRHVVVLGVTGIDAAGNRSPELAVTVTVRPHTIWYSTGAAWAATPALWSDGSKWVDALPVSV